MTRSKALRHAYSEVSRVATRQASTHFSVGWIWNAMEDLLWESAKKQPAQNLPVTLNSVELLKTVCNSYDYCLSLMGNVMENMMSLAVDCLFDMTSLP